VKGNLGPTADTGRPGRAALPALAHSPISPPAGYEPDKLDTTIRSYVGACEKNIRTAESLGTKVEAAITALINLPATTAPDAIVAEANMLTKLHERMTKASLNLVKSTDELTRLRSFLAGGPDSRPDLTVRGEIELRGLLLVAVKQLGWSVRDAAGKAIDVEVAA
jgi:hypothetical protein